MWQDIILWLIIGVAAFYVGRNIYRTLSGRSRGCGSCSDSPPPQQTIPDIKKQSGKSDL